MNNATKHDRKLVCLRCQTIGFSPRDCTAYMCKGCTGRQPHKAGHLKFTHAALDRHKKNPDSTIPFRCVDCTEEKPGDRGQKRSLTASTQHGKEPEQFDVKKLLHTLRSKEAWRCTCKRTQPAPKTRAKSAISGKSHDAKCMLHYVYAHEKKWDERRWDGKNLGITLEQLQYLADRNLY